MKKFYVVLLAGLCSNCLLMAQSDPIFPKLDYRTWVIPFKRQANPVLYEVKDSSLMVTLATHKNLYNQGKYTISEMNIYEINEIKYAKKGRAYWVPVGGIAGLALGFVIGTVYNNSNHPTTLNEGFSIGAVSALAVVVSTGVGLAIGAIIKGGKTTLLVQGNQTKYDLYKNRLNELALLENQLPAVKDTDGNKYTTSRFCGKEWMRENLKVTRYRNGDNIPEVKDAAAWGNTQEGAFCWYNNNSRDRNSKGLLYNRNAIDDPRGLCPEGWHIPSYQEWSKLISCFSKDNPDSPRYQQLMNIKDDTTNLILQTQYSFGFPTGFRDENGKFSSGHSDSQWWTSSSPDSTMAKALVLQYKSKFIFFPDFNTEMGLSVRCVRD